MMLSRAEQAFAQQITPNQIKLGIAIDANCLYAIYTLQRHLVQTRKRCGVSEAAVDD
ncbi:hypothetical protein [Bradyrhizobium australiense]|uniref:Uncharacterized protein n=1 Tax=Bradyrhizobium australiense TaxID=2721161 RepID=A0A7Y4LZT1_9BRAD|nr:hypothetical protein [Bradyrhizobium australiense]NOJ44641.1 hypothetical protein [Bradyrhizobium australiense]